MFVCQIDFSIKKKGEKSTKQLSKRIKHSSTCDKGKKINWHCYV